MCDKLMFDKVLYTPCTGLSLSVTNLVAGPAPMVLMIAKYPS